MTLVKFIRGLDANYNQTIDKDCIYFATDTGTIYLNGTKYGGDSDLKVADVTVENSIITIVYTDGTAKKIEPYNVATETSAGLMSSEDKAIVNEVSESLKSGMAFISVEQAGIIAEVKAGKYDNKVEGVVIEDKILSLNDKLLSANISLSYDEINKKIKLLGKDNAELSSVDASSFIKDGMLEDVSVVEASVDSPIGENTSGKYILFTWKVLDGETKTDYIAVSDLVSDYTAGNGIAIEGGVVRVKVYDDDPYLTVDSDGIKTKGITEAIESISGIKVSIGKSIIDSSNSEIISANTTISDAIQTLVNRIEIASAGGITAIINEDGYIGVTGDGTSKTLTLNVNKIGTYMVDNKSSLKVDENTGKLSLQWEEL